ncbi:unnamed protein product [Effrenium voratum]|nr:unnamed protein product [Effrenium voratum]
MWKCALSRRQWGVLLATVGTASVSPDSLLIRLANLEQPSRGCVLFYICLFQSVATTLGLVLVYRGPAKLLEACLATGWHFWAAAFFLGLCDVTFTLAIQLTSVANVLVLVNASPLWCAIFSWLLFKERPPLHTLAALLLGVACVGAVFLSSRCLESLGAESIWGDLLGLGTGICLALYLTTCRHCGMRRPDCSLVPAAMSGAWLAVLLSLAYAGGQVGAACWPESGIWGWAWSVMDGSVCKPLCLVCLTIAPRYIMSSEVAMIMLLEVLLGPLLAWLALGEAPPDVTLAAGVVLFVVLLLHEGYSARLARKLPAESKVESCSESTEAESVV